MKRRRTKNGDSKTKCVIWVASVYFPLFANKVRQSRCLPNSSSSPHLVSISMPLKLKHQHRRKQKNTRRIWIFQPSTFSILFCFYLGYLATLYHLFQLRNLSDKIKFLRMARIRAVRFIYDVASTVKWLLWRKRWNKSIVKGDSGSMWKWCLTVSGFCPLSF